MTTDHSALVARLRELETIVEFMDDAEVIRVSASAIEALLAECERLRETLLKIIQWADAYPLDVFPEPDWNIVREALRGSGITLDSVSASNMRHVVVGVGKIARAAIKDAP